MFFLFFTFFNIYLYNTFVALIDNKKKNIFFLALSFIFLLLFYDLPIVNLGGGIFYKISKFFYIQIFYLFSFMGDFFYFIIICEINSTSIFVNNIFIII